jgi:hypothetical protein
MKGGGVQQFHGPGLEGIKRGGKRGGSVLFLVEISNLEKRTGNRALGQAYRHTPVISALGKRQEDHDFEASLGYLANSRPQEILKRGEGKEKEEREKEREVRSILGMQRRKESHFSHRKCCRGPTQQPSLQTQSTRKEDNRGSLTLDASRAGC